MKTLTFTVEDALLSPMSFAILSGAGLIKGEVEAENQSKVHVHTTATALVDADGNIDLSDALNAGEEIDEAAPIFVVTTDDDGSIAGELISSLTVKDDKKSLVGAAAHKGETVFVDFYITKNSYDVSELQIDAANFAGNYYVEASTLFRRQVDGIDLPAELTLPNVKIQSNFTFSMASSGDPSTFTFTMDALPGYTWFDKTKKVLCVIQIVEDTKGSTTNWNTVMSHAGGETAITAGDEDEDSVVASGL